MLPPCDHGHRHSGGHGAHITHDMHAHGGSSCSHGAVEESGDGTGQATARARGMMMLSPRGHRHGHEHGHGHGSHCAHIMNDMHMHEGSPCSDGAMEESGDGIWQANANVKARGVMFLRVVFVFTLTLSFAELAAGIVSKSLLLLEESVHMFADSMSFGGTLGSRHLLVL